MSIWIRSAVALSFAFCIFGNAAFAEESICGKLGEDIDLLKFEIDRVPGDEYMVTCTFRANAPVKMDYTVYIQASLDTTGVPFLSRWVDEPGRPQRWVFEPQPPTSTWLPGETIVLRHKIRIAPVPCRIGVNLISQDTQREWRRIQPDNIEVGRYLTPSNDVTIFSALFDRALAQIDEHTDFLVDYYLISDQGGMHALTMELVPLTQVSSVRNVPPECSVVTRNAVFDRWVTASADGKTFYVSPQPDFAGSQRVELLQELPGVQDWYLHSVQDDKLVLRYAHLYHNCDYITSLVRMYSLTGNKTYLERARKTCLQLIKRIRDDGKIRRHFSGRPAEYNGMTQTYVMRSLLEYQKQDWTCPEINDALVQLCRSYEFTAEGTWNHWHNAMMGWDICSDILGKKLREENPGIWEMEARAPRQAIAGSWLKVLGEQVKEFEGRIAKTMKETNPQYPYFAPSYQPYENMLMVKLINEYYTDVDCKVSEFYPLAMAHTETMYRKDDARHRSLVMEAKYHALCAFGWRDDAFEDEFEAYCNSFADMPYEGTNQMVYRLQCVSLLLQYKAVKGAGTSAGDVDRDGLADDWEVKTFGLTHRAGVGTDADEDGLSDEHEMRLLTDPLKADSDGDTIPDKVEVILGLNPAQPDKDLDSDGDGISNVSEWIRGTNPSRP